MKSDDLDIEDEITMNTTDARLISRLIYYKDYSRALNILLEVIEKQEDKNKKLERRVRELEVANVNFKFNVAEVIAEVVGNLVGSPYAFSINQPFDLSQTRDLIMQALDNESEVK